MGRKRSKNVYFAGQPFYFQQTDRGLINIFTKQQATPEQTHDLINARKLGEQSYLNFVTHRILQQPSVSKAPVRRKSNC